MDTAKRTLDFVNEVTTTPSKKQRKRAALKDVDVDKLVDFIKEYAKRVQEQGESADVLSEVLELFCPKVH